MVQSNATPYPYTKTWAQAKNEPIITIHTSGSTGAPKPITYNNMFFGVMDYQARIGPYNGLEYLGINIFGPKNGVQTRLFSAFPMFHLAGKHVIFLAFILLFADYVIGKAFSPRLVGCFLTQASFLAHPMSRPLLRRQSK